MHLPAALVFALRQLTPFAAARFPSCTGAALGGALKRKGLSKKLPEEMLGPL